MSAPGLQRPALAELYPATSALLLAVTLLFATVPSGFVYDLTGSTQDIVEGSWLNRLQWVPLFLVAAFLLWRVRTTALAFVREINPFLLAFIGLIFISALWSPVPGITLRRAIPMLGGIMIAASLHLTGWYPRRSLWLMYLVFGLLIAASVIAAVGFPGFGVHQTGAFTGQWRGIRLDKNLLANLAALGMLFGAHALLTDTRRRWLHLGYFLMATLTMIMSGAKGSLVATAVGLLLMWFLARPPVSNRHWLAATLVTGALALAVPLFFYSIVYGIPTYTDIFGPFFELLGKEPNLTGRDEIWVWLLPIVAQHWLLGYGFGAFWLGDFGLSGEITEKLGYYPWQAHNGLLEITNELGVVGLILVLGFFVWHFRQLYALRRLDNTFFVFAMPLVIMILVNNISESSILNSLNIYTLALLFTSMEASRQLWRHRAATEGDAISRRPAIERVTSGV